MKTILTVIILAIVLTGCANVKYEIGLRGKRHNLYTQQASCYKSNK